MEKDTQLGTEKGDLVSTGEVALSLTTPSSYGARGGFSAQTGFSFRERGRVSPEAKLKRGSWDKGGRCGVNSPGVSSIRTEEGAGLATGEQAQSQTQPAPESWAQSLAPPIPSLDSGGEKAGWWGHGRQRSQVALLFSLSGLHT